MSDKARGDKGWSLSLPKRVTKQNYDENEYFRKTMANEKGAPKLPRPLGVQDFQFFDSIRLEELRQIEMRHYEYRRALYDRRYASEEEQKALEASLPAAPPLSAEELEEREQLMSEGFTSWTRKDLVAFVRGCEMYGRNDLAGVAQEVEGKTPKEVARYAITFFQRFAEIKEWEKLMRRIEWASGWTSGADPRWIACRASWVA